MSSTLELYKSYVDKMNRIADLKNASAVLQWDQETYLPVNGAHYRGKQLSTLAELAHHYFSEDALRGLLEDLLAASDLQDKKRRNVELTYEDYIKNKKYTPVFVRELSEQTHKSFHSWLESRKKNSFTIFEKDLDLLIKLKIKEADIIGYDHHPYNALLNEFERNCTVSLLDKTFSDLLPSLKNLLDKIKTQPPINDSFLKGSFPKQAQWDWGLYLISQLNFDFESGRQDISEHPFSTSFNSKDVRITTRIDESDFGNMTWSCIHETGHALYEQGLPADEYGLPLGEACSYSIHESQSRLWENNIGRSKPFWEHFFPILNRYFPEQFKGISLEGFYKGINKVKASFIRTEADEITYHFHVFIRYQLEKELIAGNIKTKEIPAFWNEQYKKWLNVEIKDDKIGCLQDVHWSHGSFGYFPTYSLGSFYAAQFFESYKKLNPAIDEQIKNGNLSNVLVWLRENIHNRGKYYSSEDLCQKVTGDTLKVNYFVDYLLHKYGSIYNLTSS